MHNVLKNQRGQTATEYILMISVVVLGLLGAASFLLPNMQAGVGELNKTLTSRFKSNPLTHCDAGSGAQCGGE